MVVVIIASKDRGNKYSLMIYILENQKKKCFSNKICKNNSNHIISHKILNKNKKVQTNNILIIFLIIITKVHLWCILVICIDLICLIVLMGCRSSNNICKINNINSNNNNFCHINNNNNNSNNNNNN